MNTKIVFAKKNLKLRNAVLIVGLPGMGLVGKIAAEYLLKQLGSEKIADIYSDSFPPAIHHQNGIATCIKDELQLFKGKKQDFIFLVGPVQPALDFRITGISEHYEFAQSIVDAAKKIGVKEIITLAGIDIDQERLKKQPKIIVAATDEKIKVDFVKLGALIHADGLVNGAAGLILGLGAKENIPGACLMGETSTRLVMADHASAKIMIEILIKKFDFNVKVTEIEKAAKKVEESFSKLVKQFEEQKVAPEPETKEERYIR